MGIPRLTKKMAAAGLVAAIALGAGGIAAAWFASTGTGSGTASVGSIHATDTLTIAVTSTSGGPLLPTALNDPNRSVETVYYYVSNTTEADVRLSTVTISVAHTGTTAVKSAGGKIAGCKYTWFALTGVTQQTSDQAKNVTLKPASDATTAQITGSFTIQLVESTSPQTACKTAHPKFTLHAG